MSQMVYVTNGTTITFNFYYDAAGQPLSVNVDGTDYYYVTDLQGDVTAILNTSGTKVISYEYDAWGKITDCQILSVATPDIYLAFNPLLYRGYVFDVETELYYLQSRYYDPDMGRFLNADAYTSTGQGILSCNMFAYCANNPVNAIDPTGESFFLLAGLIGAALGAVIGGSIAASQGQDVLAGAAAGAIAGGLCGLGIGAASSVLLAGTVTASTSAVVSGASTLASAIGSGGMSAGAAFVQGNIVSATTYTGVSLYAGGEAARSAAESFSKSSGGITIHDTWIGRTAAFVESVAPGLSRQIWSKASEFFCQHVSGEVNVFISNSCYDPNQSIYWNYELPALINSNYYVEIIMEIFE